jgi:hypothetical protein
MNFRCPPPCEKPIDAVTIEGEVVLMGEMVSVSMTPEAALQSADRIRRAAEEALRKREIGPTLGSA